MAELIEALKLGVMMGDHMRNSASRIKERWNTISFPEIAKTASELSKISEKIENKHKPSPMDLQALLIKMQRLFHKGKGKREELSGKELRNLPYILMADSNSLGMVQFIFGFLDLDNGTQFRRTLYTFFNTYDRKDKRSVFLQERLSSRVSHHPVRLDFLRENRYLVSKDGTKVMGRYIMERGIEAYLKSIGFPSSLYTSRFVQQAIYDGLASSVKIKVKMDCLQEMQKNPLYKGMMPYVVEPLIIDVETSNEEAAKTQLMGIIFDGMGDPRGRNTGWVHVSKEAKDIFLSWMVKNDFAVFFALIERTAGQTNDGDRMWKYRQAFWRAYMKEISMSRIILGSDARNLVRILNKKLSNYDLLEGKSSDISMLVFRIREYTFFEVSSNGKLRVFRNADAPIDFYSPEHKWISYGYITQCHELESFVHTNPRGKGPTWQPKVRDWIYDHCGIWREPHQWRL